MNNGIIKKYLKEVDVLKESGEGREETYYSKLEVLLNETAKFYGRNDIVVYPHPSRAEYKNPDFKVISNNGIIGYIEAKKPGEDLVKLEKTDQVKGYLNAYKNLITTDFYNFRLYRDKEVIKEISLKSINKSESFNNLFDLMKVFFEYSTPRIYTAEMLAKDLANRTKLLKSQAQVEITAKNEDILDLYKIFREFLMNDLTPEKFADIFSQTITYGLFISRIRVKNKNEFSRETAFKDIPVKIGVLKKIFVHILTNEDIINKDMKWMIDDIVDVLKQTDVNTILKEHHDPVIHFYETFLAEYNPEIRKRDGVYYTPDPVVSYISESLNWILINKFKKPTGFADESVTVLDPASGTMTFMSKVIDITRQEFPHPGAMQKLVEEHILKDFYAFEIMMAPYTIGHLRMMTLLEDIGYEMKENDKFNLYLTNALAITGLPVTKFFTPTGKALIEETKSANKVKSKTNVLAILGNPPYSVDSKNKDGFILELMKSYKEINGNKLEERNTKVIMDDYVKFIRFAQHKINKNGEGIIGFITNHSFIDNITFRGMRHSLMETFNEIYILDLHGNADKQEICPDGSKDENVFNIKRGVCISFFIKKKDTTGIKIYHKDLWGMQEFKYEWLLNNDFENTEWEELEPNEPNYFFTPQDEEHRNQYEMGWKVTDIFPVNNVGITTARDNLTIQFTKDEMWKVVQDFSRSPEEEARVKYNLRQDTRDWKIKLAQEGLIETGPNEDKITTISYRPFDERYTYYINKSRSFLSMPRPKIMQYMLNKKNVGLLISRQQQTPGFKHVFITNDISESCVVSNKSKEGTYLFPLYNNTHTQSNIENSFIKLLTKIYNMKPSPENILYYIYGVLYSETYRAKYIGFLKTDFPQIPFTTSHEVFLKMALLGEQLADLHLMKSNSLNKIISPFKGDGDFIIQKIKREDNKVYINKNQFFDGIEDDVWEYEIGSYKVLDKWLKSHKGRELTLEDITHFSKIVVALSETIKVQVEIDKIYPEIEKSILKINEPTPLSSTFNMKC